MSKQSKQSKQSINPQIMCQISWKVYTRKNKQMKYSLDKFSNDYKPMHKRKTENPVLVKTFYSESQAIDYIYEYGKHENVYLIEVWRNNKLVNGNFAVYFPCSCCNFVKNFLTKHSQKWAYSNSKWHKSNYVHSDEFVN